MMDILNFNTLITPNVLIFFYYVGALVFPLILWSGRFYLLKKFAFLHTLEKENKKLFWISLFTMFFCTELCWRMMFEMMIAYFDMHNYLYDIAQSLNKKV